MKKRLGITVNGEPREVFLLERTPHGVRFEVAGREYLVELEREVPGAMHVPRSPAQVGRTSSGGTNAGSVTASLPGVVVDVLVKKGERVSVGTVLLRIEAMKMQNSVFAPRDGTVREIHVCAGNEVTDGQLLVSLEASDE